MDYLITRCRQISRPGTHRAWTGRAAHLVSMLMLLMTLSFALIPGGALAADDSVTSTVTVDATLVVCGGTIAVTIVVTNNSPEQIDDATVHLFLPTGFVFAGANSSQGDGSINLITSEFDFNFRSIGSGSSANIVVNMRHTSGNGGTQLVARDNRLTWTDSDNVPHMASMPDPTLVVTGCDQDIAPTTAAAATIGGSTAYTFDSWTNQPVTVTLTPTDDSLATGIAETLFTIDGGSTQTYAAPFVVDSEGDHPITFWSIDTAGYVEAPQSVVVKLDLTDPTITYTGNQETYTVDQDVNIVCSATDTLSPLESSTCENITGRASSFGLGAHTFSATATDQAGNVGTGSVTFTVGVTPESLCTLTQQYVTNRIEASILCATLARSSDVRMSGHRIFGHHVSGGISSMVYIALINRDRTLTADQKSMLIEFARAL